MIASKVMALSSRVDFLVMGAGVAGLRAAVELADHGEVLVVTKESLRESNTHYAQGGIAVAMEGDEDVALHLKTRWPRETGWCIEPAAEVLVTEGPLRVAELIEWGATFDREGWRAAADARGRALAAAHSACQRRRDGSGDQPVAGGVCAGAQAAFDLPSGPR